MELVQEYEYSMQTEAEVLREMMSEGVSLLCAWLEVFLEVHGVGQSDS